MTDPNYKQFAIAILTEVLLGSDWDGGSLQDLAVNYGILNEVPYDSDVHGPVDIDMERGDPWFVFANEKST